MTHDDRPLYWCEACGERCTAVSDTPFPQGDPLGAMWQHRYESDCCGAELKDTPPEDDDPTPWCHGCGALSEKACACGPIADNE